MRVSGDDLLGNFRSQRVVDLIEDANVLASQSYLRPGGGFASLRSARFRGPEPAAQKIAPFAADGHDLNSLTAFRIEKARCGFQDVGVEGACKAFVTGNHDQQNVLLRPPDEKRMQWLARG